MKRRTVYAGKSSSGWMTLLKVILIAIAIGVAVYKIYDRFLKKFVEKQALKSAKSASTAKPTKGSGISATPKQEIPTTGEKNAVSFEASAEDVIANISELQD